MLEEIGGNDESLDSEDLETSPDEQADDQENEFDVSNTESDETTEASSENEDDWIPKKT